MRVLLDVQKKLLPDLLDVLGIRFRILRFISLMEPIGRRSVATCLGMSERVLRSEATFLKDQGLVDMAAAGMSLTVEGKELLLQLEDIMSDIFDLKNIEVQLKRSLGLSEVIVVPGNSDEAFWVKKDLGRATVRLMKRYLAKEQTKIVALTGGTTLASAAEMMTPDPAMKETLFVPARGGLGEQVENQANMICAAMAARATGQYRLLHVPDQLSQDSYSSLMEEPKIKEILQIIRSANIVVHGIGDARTMAERRSSTKETVQILEGKQAVAEAFGYYFNHHGDIVHRLLTIGLQLEDISESKHVVAVAGGASKAQAIKAVMRQNKSKVLITDEGAAKALLQIDS